MQAHKPLMAPPETHGHTPLHGQNNKLVPSTLTQTAKPREYVHTQKHTDTDTGAGLLRPGHPRRPKEKKHRQGKLRIPRGKLVPLVPRPTALALPALPRIHASLVSLCSSECIYPLPAQDRGPRSRMITWIWPSLIIT